MLPLFPMLHDTDGSEKTNSVILDKPRPKISRRDPCDEMGLPRLKRFLHMDAHRAPATKQNDLACVDTKAVSDRIRVKQAVRSLLLPDIRNLAKDLIAIDRTIDDDVSDVNNAWPEFACEGLADHPEPCFCSGDGANAALPRRAAEAPL
jgi:hypothetical protein